ncbi:MAG: hypothetical protein LBR84_03975 [Tannerella sp.]|jgi:hypothetical protein|nr:hypothetical protein [Tannerella sp.]
MNSYISVRSALAGLFLSIALSAYGRSDSDDDYSRFFLSINAGFNTQLGTSSSKTADGYTVPYSKTGINPSLDAAYFFSKHFGIGLSYCFFNAQEDQTIVSEYAEQAFEYPVYVQKESSFDEYAHYIGPALFARSFFGDNWIFSANLGAGMLHNKISNGIRKETYHAPSLADRLITPGDLPQDIEQRYAFANTVIGLHFSAGVHYRISRIFGLGLRANGLFSNYNLTPNNSKRYVNRLGLSAAFDFSF